MNRAALLGLEFTGMKHLTISLVAMISFTSCVGPSMVAERPIQSGEYHVRKQEKAFYLSTPTGTACSTAIARTKTLARLSALLNDGDTQRLYIEYNDLDGVWFRNATVLDFGDGSFVSSAALIRYNDQEYFTDCDDAKLVEILDFRSLD